jgi:exopolysaccharide biosynthesis polyprenyl glycosylphosphotransferase
VIIPIPNPEQNHRAEVDWARLIPGQSPALTAKKTGGKKPPQSVRSIPQGPPRRIRTEESVSVPVATLAALLPGPLLSRAPWRWLRSIGADFALVAMNWLLIGTFLVPLREIFPNIRYFEYAAGAPVSMLGIAVLHAALITLVGQSEGLYVRQGDFRARRCVLIKSVLWATTVLCCAYAMQGAAWSTIVLIYGTGLVHFVALTAWRRQSGRLHPENSGDSRNVLIVGAGTVGRRVASYLEEHPEISRTVYGFLDNDRRLGDRVIGRVGDLARLARTGFVDEVILAAPRDRDLTLQVLREAQRLRLDVEIIPELFGCTPAIHEVEQVGGLPVICLHAERLPAAGLALKRCVDVVGSVFTLTILSPLLAVIAVLIKLDSPGPVFYRAPRAGRKGRLFRCYKFRTMVRNADELKPTLQQGNQRSGPFFKIAGDPRITALGRFLRRYSLDELPQLWNVLKGEMSMVGPRPHTADDYAAYDIEHLARLDVTPGITGLWQVTARRDPSFERGMELDREYIRTWSITSDVRILLKTFLAVARGSGQ